MIENRELEYADDPVSAHVAWCKMRAEELLAQGDWSGAFTSFQSDMRKHTGTMNHSQLTTGMSLLLAESSDHVAVIRRWIQGFR